MLVITQGYHQSITDHLPASHQAPDHIWHRACGLPDMGLSQKLGTPGTPNAREIMMFPEWPQFIIIWDLMGFGVSRVLGHTHINNQHQQLNLSQFVELCVENCSAVERAYLQCYGSKSNSALHGRGGTAPCSKNELQWGLAVFHRMVRSMGSCLLSSEDSPQTHQK